MLYTAHGNIIFLRCENILLKFRASISQCTDENYFRSKRHTILNLQAIHYLVILIIHYNSTQLMSFRADPEGGQEYFGTREFFQLKIFMLFFNVPMR